MELFFLIGFIGALVALLFAQSRRLVVMACPEGNDRMRKIASAIREGANAYLKQQYATVARIFAIVFVVLLLMAFGTNGSMLSKFTPFAFLSGGIFSMLAGYIGMKISTQANSRTASAASKSLNRGLRVAFASGSVMGFTVVGLGILDISCWFFLLRFIFGISDPTDLGNIMVMNGMGASFMALFARVGGGIYTKAADVGADLVGKVEAGIPEDDPRNPATIADNVGDNVGDVAGMGADLYESYVGSILATFSLGPLAGYGYRGMLLPMALAVTGILCSVLGTFLVRTDENTDQKALLGSLRRGTYSAAILAALFAAPLTYVILGNMSVYVSILCGLAGGTAIGYFTEYYTSDSYRPTQELSASAQSGTGPLIIGGISLGLKSTMSSILIVAAAVIISFIAAGGYDNYNQGLYGIGIAAVGMLSTTAVTVAVDAYGPIADNAGGIAEMSGLEESVRGITDKLDAVGNTTAAMGKGFAIGSAALTALALFAAYAEAVQLQSINVLDSRVTIGLLLGAMLPFLFSAFTMSSVSRAAFAMIEEVRRQFREKPGIMQGTERPDYKSCVAISTNAALKEMIVPGLLAVAAPLAVGLLLGAEALGGLLAGALASGVMMAIFMSNSGGAWDNAKKYIEGGHNGGKGSEAHKAAVVGDTVGDPFKDTSGPSINILIKLMTVISLVFAPLFLSLGGIL